MENNTNTKKACGLCCTKIKNISVKYGNEYVLKNVNIHIHCGQLTTIIGKNGAGKSTLLKAILGDIKHEGTIEFMNKKQGLTKKLKIGYVPQKLDIEKHNPTSVYDLFASSILKKSVFFFEDEKTYNLIYSYLKEFNAESLINKKLGELSGGELQRVLISFAIISNPELLILDEPISGVDAKGIDMFYNIINSLKQKYDMAIILVSHDFKQVAEYSDHVILLDRSVITEGTPKQVFESIEFKKYFDIDVIEGGI